jgi:hypothetical protein
VAERAYSVYAGKYGTSQSLARLAERGGFAPGEMDEFLPGWREDCAAITDLRRQLAEAEQRCSAQAEAIRVLEESARTMQSWHPDAGLRERLARLEAALGSGCPHGCSDSKCPWYRRFRAVLSPEGKESA